MSRNFESVFRGTETAREREIAALNPWYHNLHLPSGEQTAPEHPLGDFPAFKWRDIEPYVPDDLSGWTALDIGCNAGFYSLRLAERGAQVLSLDVDEHYLSQARWAARQFGLEDRIQFRQAQVYDLLHEKQTFDLVWFMGVFYHLRYPLVVLDALSLKTNRMMVFQTLTYPASQDCHPPDDMPLAERARLTVTGWPKLAFIENRMQGDPTNWWAANSQCVEAMLRSAALDVVAKPHDETWICKPLDHPRAADRRAVYMEQFQALAPFAKEDS